MTTFFSLEDDYVLHGVVCVSLSQHSFRQKSAFIFTIIFETAS